MSKHSPASGSDNKKRRLNSPSRESPLIFLNVGGRKRDVPRSLLNKLRDASCLVPESVGAAAGATNNISGSGNPLCDIILMGADHWSDVPTTSDADGTMRIYLDRNPLAFDDLLEYIEYGTIFLKDLIRKDESGARLDRLRVECDYFTVDTLVKDVDEVMFGEAVTFRSDGWFSLQTEFVEDENGGRPGFWRWEKKYGNESIATRVGRSGSSNPLSIVDVNTTGTYLMLFSFHTIAVTALTPGNFYPEEEDDECLQVSVFHDEMTESSAHWTYPLVRCAAFDYRGNQDTRRNEPLLFTAAFAEPVTLKKGNQLYITHGKGIVNPSGLTCNEMVTEFSGFDQAEPHCTKFMTLIRIFGDNICKWNVKGDNDEESELANVVEWVPAADDLPKSNLGIYLDEKDATKIRFRKAGYYLLLGRIAGTLKKERGETFEHEGAIQLEHRTNGGKPLQIDAGVVSFSDDYTNSAPLYNKKMVEYGPINDIVYAESESYISARAVGEARFVHHGTAPGPTIDKIPTQSLTAMRLGDMRVDRYRLSSYLNDFPSSYQISYKRALGGKESVPNQAPLFNVLEADIDNDECAKLIALEDCQCMIIGCMSCEVGYEISLIKNDDALVHSQVCKDEGHGYGSHTLNTVVDIKAGDTICLKPLRDPLVGERRGHGHLAFLVLR